MEVYFVKVVEFRVSGQHAPESWAHQCEYIWNTVRLDLLISLKKSTFAKERNKDLDNENMILESEKERIDIIFSTIFDQNSPIRIISLSVFINYFKQMPASTKPRSDLNSPRASVQIKI